MISVNLAGVVTLLAQNVRPKPGGRRAETHLELKTESGTLDVHLRPSAFLSSKGFQFAKVDQVEVTGSKATFQGHEAIIAREVRKGGKVLTLRNAQGIPEWSGGVAAAARECDVLGSRALAWAGIELTRPTPARPVRSSGGSAA